MSTRNYTADDARADMVAQGTVILYRAHSFEYDEVPVGCLDLDTVEVEDDVIWVEIDGHPRLVEV